MTSEYSYVGRLALPESCRTIWASRRPFMPQKAAWKRRAESRTFLYSVSTCVEAGKEREQANHAWSVTRGASRADEREW